MKGLTILLVDDEPLMRLSMVDALEAVGYDVHARAPSGTEGIDAIRERPFDLVITDLRLPGADGLTVLKAAKEQIAPDGGRDDHRARIGGNGGGRHEARARSITSQNHFRWTNCC